MVKCPFTRTVFYLERLNGALIEVDPDKVDKVFELGERLEYQIWHYLDEKGTEKQGEAGVTVTIKDPMNKVHEEKSDIQGTIYLKPDQVGIWALTYYDQYVGKFKLVTFTVVEPAVEVPEPIPEPETPPEPVPKPVEPPEPVQPGLPDSPPPLPSPILPKENWLVTLLRHIFRYISLGRVKP